MAHVHTMINQEDHYNLK